MTLGEVGLAVLFGLVGVIAHLACTHQRTRLAARGRVTLALLLFPVGLLGPAAMVVLASTLGERTAWLTSSVIVLFHFLCVRLLRRALLRTESPPAPLENAP